jgi:hypothetical protein
MNEVGNRVLCQWFFSKFECTRVLILCIDILIRNQHFQ